VPLGLTKGALKVRPGAISAAKASIAVREKIAARLVRRFSGTVSDQARAKNLARASSIRRGSSWTCEGALVVFEGRAIVIWAYFSRHSAAG
jgi:hypothetical protein